MSTNVNYDNINRSYTCTDPSDYVSYGGDELGQAIVGYIQTCDAEIVYGSFATGGTAALLGLTPLVALTPAAVATGFVGGAVGSALLCTAYVVDPLGLK